MTSSADKHRKVLTHLRRNEWDRAHAIVMGMRDKLAFRIHGLLHRIEGDLDNARYWYARARRAVRQIEERRVGDRGNRGRAETPSPRYARRRRDSNRHTPLATETFRLSTLPRIGMRTRRSQRSRVSRRMPSPSAPSTHAIAAGSSDS